MTCYWLKIQKNATLIKIMIKLFLCGHVGVKFKQICSRPRQ